MGPVEESSTVVSADDGYYGGQSKHGSRVHSFPSYRTTAAFTAALVTLVYRFYAHKMWRAGKDLLFRLADSPRPQAR